ncbi:MAG: ubiquitin-like domain-containing protein, partial [Candidatus Microsaccharimonas sp.]
MKRILRRSTTYIGVSIVAVVLFVFGAFILNQQASASNQSGRLITIHDRGEEKLILSDATTIADALNEAGITLDSKDAVEPALGEKLVASEYSVNIYRARPVVIVDGATRQKVVTPFQSATQIVKDAGITLYPEDTTSLSRSDDIVGNGAGLELAIDR